MTLKEWAAKQPARVSHHPKFFNTVSIPDVVSLVDRSEAWDLLDYIVSSVSGGMIWFAPRHPVTKE